MNLTLLYLHVTRRIDPAAPESSFYTQYHERFARTYREFKPGIPHNLVIVSCGALPGDECRRLFPDEHKETYVGAGWDIGAYQAIATTMATEWVLCLATPVYFWRPGWLEKLCGAIGIFGDGLYGFQASYENHPHIRTSSFAFPTRLMREYPHVIDSRNRCERFESGCHDPSWNFTAWVSSRGLPTVMVAASGNYNQPQWRKPANIFRRGDQSNCLVWDRHNDIYREAGPERKLELEKQAGG